MPNYVVHRLSVTILVIICSLASVRVVWGADKLTNARALTAIKNCVGSNGAPQVLGVQDNQNGAIADVQFTNFATNNNVVGNLTKTAQGDFVFYNDGRWVLRTISFGLTWQINCNTTVGSSAESAPRNPSALPAAPPSRAEQLDANGVPGFLRGYGHDLPSVARLQVALEEFVKDFRSAGTVTVAKVERDLGEFSKEQARYEARVEGFLTNERWADGIDRRGPPFTGSAHGGLKYDTAKRCWQINDIYMGIGGHGDPRSCIR